MTNHRILAGDIGGSHISVALFEKTKDTISLLRKGRKTVDSHGSKEEILDAWVKLIQEYLIPGSSIMLGLAMPAPFDYEKGIFWIKEQGKFLSLYGVELKIELSQRLQIASENIFFVNDAEAFLRGESYFGKGRGFQNILGLTLGSGLGSSFKFGDKFKDAALWSEPFKEGIAEDYLGTAWFINWAKNHLHKNYEGVKEMLSETSNKDLVKPAFEDYAANLSEFIFINDLKFDFDQVVIGGNITKAKGMFEKELYSNLAKLGFVKSVSFSEMGEKSAFYGVISSRTGENDQLEKSVI